MIMSGIKLLSLSAVLLITVENVPSVCGDIFAHSGDVTTTRGEEFEMWCELRDDSINFAWKEYMSDSTPTTIWSTVNPEIGNPNKYEHRRVGNTFYLKIKNAQQSDAGQYTCEDLLQADGIWKFSIVVVDIAAPEFTPASVNVNQQIQLSCNLTYATRHGLDGEENPQDVKLRALLGAQEPSGGLVQPDREHLGRPDGVGTTYLFKRTGTATIMAKEADDGKPFICRAWVQAPSFSAETSKIMDIKYPTTAVTFSPMGENTFYVGEMINCTGNGNPEPEIYKWEAMSTPSAEKEREGMSLEITTDMVGQNTWTCRTTNNPSLLEETWPSNEISFLARPPQSGGVGGASTTTWSPAVLLIGLFFVTSRLHL